MDWKYKLQKLMVGRYGPDELYHFLLKFYIGLFIIDLFVQSKILSVIELLVVLFLFYRFFSKNISQRRKENSCFLKLKKKVLKPFKNIKRNYQDRDYYVYKKCPKCKTTLKLPLPHKRGIQTVKCPKCKVRMKFFCMRQQRVEVIKKNKNEKRSK